VGLVARVSLPRTALARLDAFVREWNYACDDHDQGRTTVGSFEQTKRDLAAKYFWTEDDTRRAQLERCPVVKYPPRTCEFCREHASACVFCDPPRGAPPWREVKRGRSSWPKLPEQPQPVFAVGDWVRYRGELGTWEVVAVANGLHSLRYVLRADGTRADLDPHFRASAAGVPWSRLEPRL
jgi:hypothetical protein